MKNKRIASALLVLLLILITVFGGCKEKAQITVTDKDGKVMAVLDSLQVSDSQGYNSGYRAYLERVVSDTLQIIQSTDNCSEKEAKAILLDTPCTINTAFDAKAYEAVEKAYAVSDIVSVPFGCAITDLNGNVCALYSAGIESERNNYSTTSFPPYSSFKPLSVYAQAVESGVINWSAVYEDSPYKEITDEDGNVSDWPVNATATYSYSNTPVYTAIAQSLNTVAVKCLDDIGVKESIEFLMNNFDIDLEYEYSKALSEGEDEVIGNIALGYLNKGVSPLDMAGYYQIFAAKGVYRAPCTVVNVCTAEGTALYENKASEKQVIKETTAGVMNLLLQGVVKDGTGRDAFNPDVPCAGKTGTGNVNDGNWFVGVVPQYSCAVWHGEGTDLNSSPKIFGEIMAQLCTESNERFDLPKNLSGSIYCTESGLSAGNKCAKIAIGYYVADEVPTVCDVHK